MPLNTPLEALTEALILAITAPDDDRANRAIALADEIAALCPAGHIALAKRAALDYLRSLDGDTANG
jgi:hypothetical protein